MSVHDKDKPPLSLADILAMDDQTTICDYCARPILMMSRRGSRVCSILCEKALSDPKFDYADAKARTTVHGPSNAGERRLR